MMQTTSMICMEVRQDECFDVFLRDPHTSNLRADFILRANVHAKRTPVVRMPPRIVIRVGTLRCFPRVDDDDALWMVDYPRVDGQPFGPSGVSKDSDQPTRLPDAVRRLYVDRACLDSMDADLHSSLLSAGASSALASRSSSRASSPGAPRPAT